MKSIVTALVDPSGAADYGPDAYVEIWSEIPVGTGVGIITDDRLRVPITSTGLSTPPIRAGNYQIRIKLSQNRTALGPYPFTMPDGDGTTELWPLIAAGVNIPPDTPIQKIQEALAAYFIANPIDGSGLDQAAVDARVETVGDTRYAPFSLADDVADKLDAAAASTLFRQPDRSSVVLIGDSRINLESSSPTVTTEPLTAQTLGAFNWANTALRHRFRVLNYAGTTGNTSAQVLARYATDCIAHNPGIVIIGVGVNDVTGNIALATTQANIESMIAQNRAIGARTVVFTVGPKNDHTTAQRLVLAQLNRWILGLGNYGDVFPADVAGPIMALTGMTWNAAFSADGLHQNKAGAARQGKVLATVLERLAPPVSPLPLYNADPLNWITNGLFDGTLGGVPSGFQAFPVESTRTLVARTDQRPGQWFQFDSPAQANNTLASGSSAAALPASVVPGTTKAFAVIEMEADVWTSVSHAGPQLSLQFDAGGAATHYVIGNAASAGDSATPYPLENQQGLGGPVVIRTPIVTVPAGTTRFRVIASCNLLGKIRWSRMGVYSV